MLTVFSSPHRCGLLGQWRETSHSEAFQRWYHVDIFLVLPQILMLAATEASANQTSLADGRASEELEPPFLLTQTGSASIPINASFDLFVEASGVNRCIISGFSMRFPSKMHRQPSCSLKLFAEQVGHYHITVSNAEYHPKRSDDLTQSFADP